MSEENQEEPSIEEILASIRQIISDDDEEESSEENNEPEAVVEAEPEPEPEPEASVEPEPELAAEQVHEEDEVLELTEALVEDEALDDDILPEVDETPMSDFDIDFDSDEEDEVETGAEAEVEEVAVIEDVVDDALEGIIKGDAAEATLGAFERLAQSIPVARTGNETNTLEDIVRDMLRPMLRQWVDANMPAIAERLVKKELERLVDKALD